VKVIAFIEATDGDPEDTRLLEGKSRRKGFFLLPGSRASFGGVQAVLFD
jgi:hypothetical protein